MIGGGAIFTEKRIPAEAVDAKIAGNARAKRVATLNFIPISPSDSPKVNNSMEGQIENSGAPAFNQSLAELIFQLEASDIDWSTNRPTD